MFALQTCAYGCGAPVAGQIGESSLIRRDVGPSRCGIRVVQHGRRRGLVTFRRTEMVYSSKKLVALIATVLAALSIEACGPMPASNSNQSPQTAATGKQEPAIE